MSVASGGNASTGTICSLTVYINGISRIPNFLQRKSLKASARLMIGSPFDTLGGQVKLRLSDQPVISTVE